MSELMRPGDVAAAFLTAVFSAGILYEYLRIFLAGKWCAASAFAGGFLFFLWQVAGGGGSGDASRTGGILITQIVLFMLVKAVRLFFSGERIKKLPQNSRRILFVIPVCSLAVVYLSLLDGGNRFLAWNGPDIAGDIFRGAAVLALMVILNLLIFTAIWNLSGEADLLKKNITYRQQIDGYNRQIRESSVQELHKARHDLKNRLIYAVGLCEKNEGTELKTVLETLIDQGLSGQPTLARSGNPVVDAVVNYKYAAAKKEGIPFDAKLDIPAELPFAGTDLSVLLGGALDNALEGALRAAAGERYVRVRMRMDGKNLIILIENSFDGILDKSEDGTLRITKEDRSGHGFGLAAIREAAARYHGQVIVQSKERKFQLKVVLYSE